MVDLFLVWVRLRIRLAYTLGDNACITLCVASVLAILALHTRGILKELATERTTHDIVKLL